MDKVVITVQRVTDQSPVFFYLLTSRQQKYLFDQEDSFVICRPTGLNFYQMPDKALSEPWLLFLFARNGVAGECRSLIKCVRFLQEVSLLQSSQCLLVGGGRGVCCPHTLLTTPQVQEDPTDRACPRNIICIPPPRNVTIPNIRKLEHRNISWHCNIVKHTCQTST